MSTTTLDVSNASAPFDALLIDAALGPVRRFTPDRSTARWAVALAREPRRTARRVGDLVAEARRIVAGTSTLTPQRSDRRFTDVAWSENPMLKRLVQLYLAGGRTLDTLIAEADLDPRDRARVRFFIENVLEAVAPSNVPLVNPASAKAAIDTGGLSLLRGGRQLVQDLASAPRVPSMVDSSGFRLGENIAATPGAVVFRNEILELIRYTPAGTTVREVPMLVLPPTINKYYAIDLAPGRSFVEHCVAEGQQAFVISWRNPDSRHRNWNFDTYVSAVLQAMDAVEEITGSNRTVLSGICSGGILASLVAGYLAGIGRQDRLAGLCLAVTVIDNKDAGTIAALSGPRLAELAKRRSAQKGYLDGRALAEVFAWLRPGDLVWNYWVNNYLLGKQPPAFDILFWNSDTTRMSAGLHADFVDMATDNLLTRPGCITVLGVPIDLGKVTVDSYVVAGVADHITPWQNCYRTTQLLGGTSRFVLSSSGHIAAIVNPPGNPKARFQVSDLDTSDVDTWLKQAEEKQGSWWPDLMDWLGERCGATVEAPEELGTTRFPELVAAPGTYVFDK